MLKKALSLFLCFSFLLGVGEYGRIPAFAAHTTLVTLSGDEEQDVCTDEAIGGRCYTDDEIFNYSGGSDLCNYVGYCEGFGDFSQSAVRFSLDTVSDVVHSAKLMLYILEVEGSADLHVSYGNGENFDFSETFANPDDAPVFPSFDEFDGIGGSKPVTESDRWLEVDVTDAVKEAMDLNWGNVTFHLTGEDHGVNYFTFVCDNEDESAELHPKLELELLDTTPPELEDSDEPLRVAKDSSFSAQSSEDGDFYLAPAAEGGYEGLAALAAASVSTCPAEADTESRVSTAGVTPGGYLLYAADESGNLSEPREIVVCDHEDARPPEVGTTHPQDVSVKVNEPAVLTAEATGTGLSYQWYRSADGTTDTGTPIGGEESSRYSPPTDTVGTFYYYCEVGSRDGDAANQEGSADTRVATVEVASVPVTGVSLSAAALSLFLDGEPATLTAAVTPDDATNRAVTWASDHPDVASVDGGIVTPHAVGTATVTVTTVDGGRTAQCAVTVSPVAVTGVGLSASSLGLHVGGEAATLTAAVSPGDATNRAVTWTSDHPEIASVADGVVTPVAAGTATITVRTEDGGFAAVCTVTVTVPVTGISLNADTLALLANGAAETLTATVAPDDATNKAVTWSSDHPEIASVAGGTVTPHAAGTATITAATADGGYAASCAVTVDPVPVTGVSLSASAMNLKAGGASGTLTAAVTPGNATNQAVTWTSDHPEIASVANGVVAPHAAGTATITVRTEDGAYSASCVVTVGRQSSGDSSPGKTPEAVAPGLPDVLSNPASGAEVDLSAVTLPPDVSSISLSVEHRTQSDPVTPAGFAVALADPQMNLIGTPVIYDIRMIDQNGNAMNSFTGRARVRLPVPQGLRGIPHVFRYEEGTGAFTDMHAVLTDGCLVFDTEHFSYYVVADVGDSITLDTSSYRMPISGQYQIGVRLTGTKTAAVKVYSDNSGTAAAERLPNGNVRVVGRGYGTAYIMFDLYDGAGRLLTHASVRVAVQKDVQPHGDSTRQIGIF